MNKIDGERISRHIQKYKFSKMSNDRLREFIEYLNWQERFTGITEREQIIEDLVDYMDGLYKKHVVKDPSYLLFEDYE